MLLVAMFLLANAERASEPPGVVIDHQPAVALNVRSIDLGLLVNNVACLARVAKGFGVPTVLTTVGAQGSVLVDPLFSIRSVWSCR